MIKKIVFSFPTKIIANIYKIKFCTKIDGEWGIYDTGALTGAVQTINATDFENIYVETTKKAVNGNVLEYVFSSSKTADNNYSQFSPTIGEITVTFKEPIRSLLGIYYSALSNFTDYVQIRVYDENDTLIYEDLTPELTANTSPSQELRLYETVGLEVMKVYPTNTVGTIETNDNTQISNIYQIESIVPTQTVPDNTDIRYLLSFDGRNTYKTYKDGSWDDVDITDTSNIMSLGLTKDEIEKLSTKELNLALTENRTLDILIGMVTQDEYNSPSISEVKVLYLRIV